MKSMKISLLVLGLILSLPSFAAKAKAKPKSTPSVSKLVDGLNDYVHGIAVHKVEGKNATEMVKYLALEVNQVDEEEFSFESYPDSVPGVDEGAAQYGLTTVAQALGMIETERDDLTDADKKKILDVLYGSKRLGAKIGYAGDGSSVCGVTWPSPLIIDV